MSSSAYGNPWFCDNPEDVIGARDVYSNMEFAGQNKEFTELSANYCNYEAGYGALASIKNFNLDLIVSPNASSSLPGTGNPNSQYEPLTAEVAPTEIRNDALSEFASLTLTSSVSRVEFSSTADLCLPSEQTPSTSLVPITEAQNGNADWVEFALRQCDFLSANCGAPPFPSATLADLENVFLTVARSAPIEIGDQLHQLESSPVSNQSPVNEQLISAGLNPVVPNSSEPDSCSKRTEDGKEPLHFCPVEGGGKDSSSHECLRTHLESHSSDRPFACIWPSCGQQFGLDRTSKEHMRTHTREKKFACEVCNKGFTFRNSLKAHMVTHTKEKKFACEKCGDKFARNDSLKSHMRLHANEKFVCELCGEKFPLSKHLNNHMMVMHKQKKFACDVCGKKYGCCTSLRRHMKIKHEGQSVPTGLRFLKDDLT